MIGFSVADFWQPVSEFKRNCLTTYFYYNYSHKKINTERPYYKAYKSTGDKNYNRKITRLLSYIVFYSGKYPLFCFLFKL